MDTQHLANAVRAARTAAGLTTKALDQLAGIGSGTTSRVETGAVASPAIGTVAAMAAALGTTVAQLIGESAAAPAAPSAAVADDAVRLLSLDRLFPSRLNPRRTFDDDALDELAASIAEQGLLQNLVVRPLHDAHVVGEAYEIVAGERRFRALGRLVGDGRWDRHADNIPCRIIAADDGAALALALLENMQRVDVNAMEEADAMATLHRMDPEAWSTAAIAQAIGKTARHVQLRIALVDKLAAEVQQALRDGEISLAQARAMTSAPKEEQREALERVTEGHHGWRRAEDIRARLLAELPPVGHAFFDLDDYTGTYVEPEQEGEVRRFADRVQFERLQYAAVREKKAELATEWAWVKVMDRRESQYFSSYDYRESKDRRVAGAVIDIGYALEVTVHTGLVSKTAAARSVPPPPDAPKASAPITKGHIVAAKAVKSHALQASVAAAPPMVAIRLAIIGMMGGHEDVRVRTDSGSPPSPGVDAGVKAKLARLGGDLPDKRPSHMGDSHPLEFRIGYNHGGADAAAMWEALIAMPDERVLQIFAHMVAAECGTFAGYEPVLADRPLAVAVARHVEVDLAAAWKPDAAWLETCRKPQLEAIVRRAGLEPDLPRPIGKAGTGELKTAILAAAADGRLQGFLPPELHFGTAADHEAGTTWSGPSAVGDLVLQARSAKARKTADG